MVENNVFIQKEKQKNVDINEGLTLMSVNIRKYLRTHVNYVARWALIVDIDRHMKQGCLGGITDSVIKCVGDGIGEWLRR